MNFSNQNLYDHDIFLLSARRRLLLDPIPAPLLNHLPTTSLLILILSYFKHNQAHFRSRLHTKTTLPSGTEPTLLKRMSIL